VTDVENVCRCRWMACSVCWLLLLGCGGALEFEGSEPQAGQPAPPIKADVVRVEPSLRPAVIPCQGMLTADQVANIATTVAGRVSRVHVSSGEAVRAGQTLVSLDSAELEADIHLATEVLQKTRDDLGLQPDEPLESADCECVPTVRVARRQWEAARAQRQQLEAAGEEPEGEEADLEALKRAEQQARIRYQIACQQAAEQVAAVQVLETRIELAQERLRHTTIKAPLDGRVENLHVRAGATVAVGAPVASVACTHPLRFCGEVSDRDARHLFLGQSVLIDAGTTPRTADVTRISPSIDLTSRTLRFEALVENPQGELECGGPVSARLVLPLYEPRLFVPRSAVAATGNQGHVWKVENGIAREQAVVIGERTDEGVEIREGLAPGELILANRKSGRKAAIEPTGAPVTWRLNEAEPLLPRTAEHESSSSPRR